MSDANTSLELAHFISSVNLDADDRLKGRSVHKPVIQGNRERVLDHEKREYEIEDRFVSSLAAVFHKIQADLAEYKQSKEAGVVSSEAKPPSFDKARIQQMIQEIDALIEDQVNEILHTKSFRELEAQWRGIADLVEHTAFKKNISLSLLDASFEEIGDDLELNLADIAGSELHKKLYVAEYDQFGGQPFGGVIGLWDFKNTPEHIKWLTGVGKVSEASHAPFVASVDPKFFGCDTMAQVAELRDIGGLLSGPKYAKWNELRETDQAAYIGLVMPKVIARIPYNEETNPAGFSFTERSLVPDEDRPTTPAHRPETEGLNEEHYLWGSAAIPFARNLVSCFARSGWCQNIRGPKAGGLVTGLPTYSFPLGGESVVKLPVEIAMPDFRELELARAGLIPLIQKKGSAEAVFFSAQSIKKAKEFKDDHQTENAQLVTNLSYTFSISRIAHYLKSIMRNNIGSTANQQYVFNQIDRWISRYVTTIVNPDDLTLQYYPFKGYTLDVNPISGKAGWYHCNLTVQPHIQFEGLSVDLRVDARLG